jgi:hypothetical protein
MLVYKVSTGKKGLRRKSLTTLDGCRKIGIQGYISLASGKFWLYFARFFGRWFIYSRG